jgi:lysophospholipase L1-like esterase
VSSFWIGFYLYNRGNSKSTASKVKSILFIGDSNTFANFSYADQLKKTFPNLIIKKIAQNGANSNWARTQLENELKTNRYDIVSILIGSNDIYGGMKLTDTKNNLDAMYNLAHSKGSKVIAVTPPNKDFYVSKTDDKQKMLSDLVNWIKNNNNKDYFIDFYNMTKDKSLFTSADGYLHPQAKAHTALENEVEQQINLA